MIEPLSTTEYIFYYSLLISMLFILRWAWVRVLREERKQELRNKGIKE